MLQNLLIVASSILTIFANIPYLIDTVRKRSKPRIVTWFTWAVLMSIAAVTSFIEGQYATVVILLTSAIGATAIVVLGWKNGDKKLEKLDKICLIGVVVGVLLWQIFNSPTIGTIAMVLIDLLGGIPTTIHAWKKPEEETAISFALFFLGATCTLVAINAWVVTAYAYPLFIALNSLMTTIVIISRKRLKTRTIQ